MTYVLYISFVYNKDNNEKMHTIFWARVHVWVCICHVWNSAFLITVIWAPVCVQCLSHIRLFPTPWPAAPKSAMPPARLLCPWDSPGKNAGMGCYFPLRGPSQPRDWTCISYVFCLSKQILRHCATLEALTWAQSTPNFYSMFLQSLFIVLLYLIWQWCFSNWA